MDSVGASQDINSTYLALILTLILQVIARIFYEVNRSWSGKITVSELRRSRYVTTLILLITILKKSLFANVKLFPNQILDIPMFNYSQIRYQISRCSIIPKS